MGLLSSGQTMLAAVMVAEGQSVTYRRGATSLTITATPDDPQDVAMSGDGLVIELGERDFAMNLSALGSLTMPADGDLIDWTNAATSKVYTYKVLPVSQGTRCFDWLDNHHKRIAVHTKLVSVT